MSLIEFKKKEYNAINMLPRTQLAFMRDSVLSRAKCLSLLLQGRIFSSGSGHINLHNDNPCFKLIHSLYPYHYDQFFHEPAMQLGMTNDRSWLTSTICIILLHCFVILLLCIFLMLINIQYKYYHTLCHFYRSTKILQQICYFHKKCLTRYNTKTRVLTTGNIYPLFLSIRTYQSGFL